MRRHQRSGGYTLIEVMMAVAIMTVGAVGIMSLAQSTTRGNVTAREITTATQITRTWVERLRRDAINWTAPGQPLTPPTVYLSNTPVAAAGMSPWFSPVPLPGTGESFAFDYLGADTTTAANMYFCTNVRLGWTINQQAIRADVRTWWHRSDANAAHNLFANCNGGAGGEAAIDAELASATPRLRAVYATTLLRRSRLPQ